jgi:methionyl-tRNA formyltransferase
MLMQAEMAIGPRETTPELAARLAEAGAPLMVETLRGLAAGTLPPQPQDHTQATYAPMLKKEDGRINWTRPAQEIYNRMRGFTPWPGSYTTLRGRTCHVLGEPVSNYLEGGSATRQDEGGPVPAALSDTAPGTIRLVGQQLLVSCGGATELRLLSVKQEGGKKVDALEFASGARLTEGERFGER